MGKILKFGAVMIGMNMIKKVQPGDQISVYVGAIILACPIIYELIPQFKKLYHYITDPPEKTPPKARRNSTSKPVDPEEAQVAKAMEVISDEKLQRITVTFQPGQLGCGFTPDGVVSIVLEDSQAAQNGLKIGWHCLEVQGEKPQKIADTQELIRKYRGGFESYSAVFLTEPEVVEANATLLAQLTKEEEEKAKEDEKGEKEGDAGEEKKADEAVTSMDKDAAEEQDGPRRRKGEAED